MDFKDYRLKYGFSRKQVALILGVTEQAVAYYENRKRNPPFDHLATLIELYNIKSRDLKRLIMSYKKDLQEKQKVV